MRVFRLFAAAAWLLAVGHPVAAEVAVCGVFGDHMVLQRDTALPVWGTARPQEQIKIAIGGREASCRADASGHWRAMLEPLAAGGPLEMAIVGENTITLRDVLVGEVWLCSGQSNMAMPVQRAQQAEQEIAQARHPSIRLLKVTRGVADEPGEFAGKQWELCSPETVPEFSAAGYFFGRDLHQALNVPIGLIDSAVGGTPAESWTPRPILDADPAYQPIFDRWNERIAAARAAETRQASQPAGARKGKAATKPAAPRVAELLRSSQRPSVLYNAMIHPLVPYAIRGVIWYQGESNAGRAYQYRNLFPAMIASWRAAWGQGDFPFLFVQLAGWEHGPTQPYESAWAELREAQTMTLSLPRTGMAVITDVSQPDNIHPVNKQEVGRRLALAARAVAYGEKLPFSGPMYASMSVEGGKIRLRFKHADGGLEARPAGSLKGFGIAGEDRKFVDAEASIDGETVLVHSDKVAAPVAVRFGWADVPDCNLYNQAGLPASPFRTDDWLGITAGKN